MAERLSKSQKKAKDKEPEQLQVSRNPKVR